MLYLHCGWPRTSTSSLQAVLFEHTDRLADAGVVYPDRWRVRGNPTHHGMAELLKASQESESALDDFKRFLAGHAGEDVLLSAEVLTYWLRSSEKLEALQRLLAAAQEVMPTRCVWTLRRIDDFIGSMYLRQVTLRPPAHLPPPTEFFENVGRPDRLFEGVCGVGEVVGEVAYVKYEAGGAHNGALLRAFDLPEPLQTEIRERLEQGPRLNAGLSHKGAVAMLNLDVLSARAGVDLDRAALRAAFFRGDFRFEGDRPCELVGVGVKRALHERGLAAARQAGLTPYIEFFEADEIRGSAPVVLGPEILTDEDLRRLVAHPGLGHTPNGASPISKEALSQR